LPNLLSGPSAPALAVASGLERARRVTAMARKGERHLGLAPTTILLGLLSTSVGGFGTDNDDLEWVRTNAITENGGGVTLNDTLPDCACKHQWYEGPPPPPLNCPIRCDVTAVHHLFRFTFTNLCMILPILAPAPSSVGHLSGPDPRCTPV